MARPDAVDLAGSRAVEAIIVDNIVRNAVRDPLATHLLPRRDESRLRPQKIFEDLLSPAKPGMDDLDRRENKPLPLGKHTAHISDGQLSELSEELFGCVGSPTLPSMDGHTLEREHQMLPLALGLQLSDEPTEVTPFGYPAALRRDTQRSHSLEYSPYVSDELADEIAFAIANWSPMPSPAVTSNRAGLFCGSKDISSPTRFCPPEGFEQGARAPEETEPLVLENEAELAELWVDGDLPDCEPDWIQIQRSISSLDFHLEEPLADTPLMAY
jgi:hypothetical protein